MSQPSSQTVTAVGPPRASSLRSVASNSSIGSGTSLTRRSRTRTRTKTLAGASRPENIDVVQSELPYLGDNLVQSPGVDGQFQSGDVPSVDVRVPARPPRSPQRVGPPPDLVDEKVSDDKQVESVACPVGAAAESPLTSTSVPNVEADKLPNVEPSILPQKTGQHPSSAFSRVEDSIDKSAPNFRDSVLTQQSFTSSSVYPQSTSTASGTESPSPRSMAEQHDNNDIRSFDPDVEEVEEFDGDDVSYRLRLLVKNNYFLPPAHSKPLPSDFAPPKKSARAAAPTFLDLFRVGKAKSKPSSPDREPLAPILRTTSDSTTASGYAPRPQARSMPQTPLPPTPPTPRSQGRVVVVREKMGDLISAAKQAEQEMKTRGGRRDTVTPIGQPQAVFDDVIDPTDAVDLPPPSANYPFTVQASALHGLGVQDSVGAALLAETLPPGSPGSSSLDPVEAAWRKALLHEAVNHSLQSSPMPTPASSPKSSSQGPRSISGKHLLGRRILHHPLLEEDDSAQAQTSPNSDPTQSTSARGTARALATPESHGAVSRSSSYLPSRAETPAPLPTPLAPPPRRQMINPLYSLSQTDLPNSARRPSSASSGPSNHSKVIRRTVSSPRLSSNYESDVRDDMAMTPPPLPRLRTTLSRTSQNRVDSSFDTNRLASVATTSDSHYSDDLVVEAPRPSMTWSLHTDGRASLSQYSQPSPSASAFHDALNVPYQSSASDSYQSLSSRTNDSSPAPRYSTMSPPPRVSSSLASFALSPPPRSSSLHNILHSQISMSSASASASGQSPASSDPGHTASTLLGQPLLGLEHATPPFPITERRGITAPTLSLHIPAGPIPMAIHSAPPPSSPTSYFDHIQTHPNAMDDLDSSSDEGDDAEEGQEEDADGDTTAVYVNPVTHTIPQSPISPSLMSMNSKSSLMRLGNHSTPHVARSYERRPSLPYGPTPTPTRGLIDRMKPVVNVPQRAPFFSDRRPGKSDHIPPLPISTFDFYAQQHPATSQRRPQTATDAGIRAWKSNQKAQASLRRLDGMVIQHMEAEKNTIKRIASSALQTKT